MKPGTVPGGGIIVTVLPSADTPNFPVSLSFVNSAYSPSIVIAILCLSVAEVSKFLPVNLIVSPVILPPLISA